MTKPKRVSQKEKLEIFEAFFQRLHFHRYLTMDEKKVMAMLALSDGYINAHSSHNGERNDLEVQNNINAALDRMRHLP